MTNIIVQEGASIFKFPNDHTFTGQSTVARSLTQATRCSPCGAWTAEHKTSHEAAMAFCAWPECRALLLMEAKVYCYAKNKKYKKDYYNWLYFLARVGVSSRQQLAQQATTCQAGHFCLWSAMINIDIVSFPWTHFLHLLVKGQHWGCSLEDWIGLVMVSSLDWQVIHVVAKKPPPSQQRTVTNGINQLFPPLATTVTVPAIGGLQFSPLMNSC